MAHKKKMSISWDKNESSGLQIFREMLWADPRAVLKKYGRETLRNVFLAHGHKADRRNRNFWKVILNIEVEELEVNRETKKSFRRDCRIWNY